MRLWRSDVTQRFACVVIGAWIALSVACRATAQTEPQTAIVVAVDLSKSFAPLRAEDRRALDALADAVLQVAREGWETPILISWSTIGSYSLLTESPCGPAVEFEPGLLPGVKKRKAIRQPNELRAWLAECIEALVKRSHTPEAYTDISGAVANAARSSARIKQKYVAILSDFVEDLPPGSTSATVQLSGDKVLMLYRPETSDKSTVNEFYARVDGWKKRFRDSGAKDVCDVPVRTATSGILMACLK